MWHNHPFSQISKATKREGRVEVGGKRQLAAGAAVNHIDSHKEWIVTTFVFSQNNLNKVSFFSQ